MASDLCADSVEPLSGVLGFRRESVCSAIIASIGDFDELGERE